MSDDPSLVAGAPRVSLILPVYNGADYLEEALASILGQSFADFEVICVDDASTDATPQLLAAAAAADSRLRLIRNTANIGLPATLNRGFAEARGEYFTWTSDDNLLRPSMLERLVAALDAHAECGVAYADYSVIDPAGRLVDSVRARSDESLLLGNHVGACFLYRREVDFALGGYDTAVFGAEDYDFWLRASAHYAFFHVPEDLYLYRKHPRSLTNSRAAAIQRLTTDVVLRAMPATMPRQQRADVLLNQYGRNFFKVRLDLLARALRAAPWHSLGQLPRIIGHAARVMWHSWRRNM